MGWLSDIISGDESRQGRAVDEDPLERTRQLREGVRRAAAALEDRHPGLSRSADETAERLLGRLPHGDGEDVARQAAERLGELHFSLLRVGVSGLAPGEVGLEEEIASVRELAERAGGGPDANGGSEDGEGGDTAAPAGSSGS